VGPSAGAREKAIGPLVRAEPTPGYLGAFLDARASRKHRTNQEYVVCVVCILLSTSVEEIASFFANLALDARRGTLGRRA